ncbi:Urea ABC transporter [Klebsiella michiganensis]|uniref:Urea ABC transporter n=1 Tax=Klebsiella michiganensis TaxID=1134687 RepID=A0A7H4MYJ1_9ENTR|nr:Urea ABC transporter [Klebsiella michiganensis]
MLLVQEPHLLLLDEPAAGMTDAETEYTAELFRTLAGQHSLMVVEHDMGFVETIADRVTGAASGTGAGGRVAARGAGQRTGD